MIWVMSCADADMDVSTSTCSAPVWVLQGEGIAPLSAADGAVLGAAIISLWCIGAAFRWARKSMSR